MLSFLFGLTLQAALRVYSSAAPATRQRPTNAVLMAFHDDSAIAAESKGAPMAFKALRAAADVDLEPLGLEPQAPHRILALPLARNSSGGY